MNKIALLWKLPDVRKKIFIVLGLLLLTRVLANIPIPSIDTTGIRTALEQSDFLGLLNIFAGGGLSNLSLAMIGLGPYITSTIIIQLLTVIIPSWAEKQKEEGEQGRAQLQKYGRYLTVPLAILQGFGTIRILQSQSQGLFTALSPFQWFLTLLAITAGSMLVMWIGEIITEYGLGNGVSLVIFAGIVAQLPQGLQALVSLYDPSRLGQFAGFLALGLAVIAGVIFVTEAQRNIPVSYARRVRGDAVSGGVNTTLPLRLNAAGVIPIIFAVSMLLFPALIAQFFTSARTPWLAEVARKIVEFSTQSQGLWYGIIYFVLVILFTYLYTAIVFKVDEVAENLQKGGGFVPGIRPGQQTAEFLERVVNRITLPGAVFLGLIAVIPFIFQEITGSQVLTLGGTSLLIVVAVVLETIKQLEAQLTLRDYEKYGD